MTGTGTGRFPKIDLARELPPSTATRTDTHEEKGRVIYTPNTTDLCLHFVETGKVVVAAPTPRGIVGLAILEAGEFFGFDIVGGSYATLAVCFYPKTRVRAWSVQTLQGIMDSQPRVAVGLAQGAVALAVASQQVAAELATLTCQERIAAFLVRQVEREIERGRGDEGGGATIAMTHEQISWFVGTSREIVTSAINCFRQASCLAKQTGKGRICVYNAQELANKFLGNGAK